MAARQRLQLGLHPHRERCDHVAGEHRGLESDTSGLLPRLTRRTGAGAPHSPWRIGGSGSATASTPASSAVQRARASSTSCGGQASAAGAGLARASASAFASGSVFGQAAEGPSGRHGRGRRRNARDGLRLGRRRFHPRRCQERGEHARRARARPWTRPSLSRRIARMPLPWKPAALDSCPDPAPQRIEIVSFVPIATRV